MDMIEVKAAELQGAALDWAVAKILYPGGGYMNSLIINRVAAPSHCIQIPDQFNRCYQTFRPSTDWSQGGPLIGEYKVEFEYDEDAGYCAMTRSGIYAWGPTHLVAAMRAIVAFKLGDTVQVPKELMQ